MGYRKLNSEYRAFFQCAFNLYCSTVHLYKCLAERQPDAGAVRMHAVNLVKTVEYVAHIPFADAFPVVGNTDYAFSIPVKCISHLDFASVRGVFEGV